MTGVFMFILFLLNIVTIFAVIVLFLRQNRFDQVEKNLKVMNADMEELMSGYIMEMKEENEVLIKTLARKNQSVVKNEEKKESSNPKQTIDVFNDISIMEDQSRPSQTYATKNKATDAYKKQTLTNQTMQETSKLIDEYHLEITVDSEKQDQQAETASFLKDTLQASFSGQPLQEPSLYEQVHLLTKQGFSAEEIAKRLKCGKTEVELLLKFHTDK